MTVPERSPELERVSEIYNKLWQELNVIRPGDAHKPGREPSSVDPLLEIAVSMARKEEEDKKAGQENP